MAFRTLFRGHLEEEKRKRHQKVVSGAASEPSGVLLMDTGHHVQSRTQYAGARKVTSAACFIRSLYRWGIEAGKGG